LGAATGVGATSEVTVGVAASGVTDGVTIRLVDRGAAPVVVVLAGRFRETPSSRRVNAAAAHITGRPAGRSVPPVVECGPGAGAAAAPTGTAVSVCVSGCELVTVGVAPGSAAPVTPSGVTAARRDRRGESDAGCCEVGPAR
jgi:hypothetical protein